MNKGYLAITLAGGVLLGVASGRADEQSVTLKMTDLPPAVHKAVMKEVGKGKVDSIEKDTDEDGVTYDVEMTKNGRTRDFTVDDDGKMLEIEVFPAETPKPVHEAIARQVGKGTIEYISKVFDDEVTFEVDMTAGGRERTFTVDKQGTLLEMQVFISETPAAVQKTITKLTQTGKVTEITKVLDDGAVSYDVEVENGGKTHVVSIAEDGTVNDTEVSLEELSPELQKSIRDLMGKDKLGDINQATEDGKVIYEVEFDSADGNAHYTTVDTNGATLYREEDIALADTPAAVQQAIKDRMGGGELLELGKMTESGDVSYDVDIKKDGKLESFSLDTDGKILPEDQ